MRQIRPGGEVWKAFPYNPTLDYANTAGTQALQFRKNVLGLVEFRGRTTSAAGQAANSVIGTLPTEYRPPLNLRFACLQGNAVLGITVANTGQVSVLSAATAGSIIELSGIRFNTV